MVTSQKSFYIIMKPQSKIEQHRNKNNTKYKSIFALNDQCLLKAIILAHLIQQDWNYVYITLIMVGGNIKQTMLNTSHTKSYTTLFNFDTTQ